MKFRGVIPFLAMRFLLTKSSEGFLSFIAWVSILGVALGILALVTVTSVINGFESELTRVITGMNGEVILYSRAGPVEKPERVTRKIREVLPNVSHLSASLLMELMASGPSGVAGALLEGMNPEEAGKVTAVPERLVAGALPQGEREVALGVDLAEKIGVKIGSQVRLIVPFVGDAPEEAKEGINEFGNPKVLEAKVVGLIQMGMYQYDSKYIWGTLKTVQEFLEHPDQVSMFRMKFPPGTDTRKAAEVLGETFGYPLRAKDWSQLNQNLFVAIELEKAVIAVILTAIIIVAAFNVVSTLMMMIQDKTKEIAILKAMGFQPGQAFRLFCGIGMGIGVVGIALGVLLGLLMNLVLSQTPLLHLPSDIYYISDFGIEPRWMEVLLITGVGLLICLIATLYPAIQVAKRSPLEGLRHE